VDDLTQATVSALEVMADAEDASKTIDPAGWLDPRTVALLEAARQSVQDLDMDIAMEAVKHPQPGQLLAAHERLRQAVALNWLLVAVGRPSFALEVADTMLTTRIGRPAHNN
jgi:hypothetical protein